MIKIGLAIKREDSNELSIILNQLNDVFVLFSKILNLLLDLEDFVFPGVKVVEGATFSDFLFHGFELFDGHGPAVVDQEFDGGDSALEEGRG